MKSIKRLQSYRSGSDHLPPNDWNSIHRENGGKTLQIEGPGPLFNLPVGALLKGIETPEIPTV